MSAIEGGIFLTVTKVTVNLCTTDYFAVLSCVFLIRLCKCIAGSNMPEFVKLWVGEIPSRPCFAKALPKKRKKDMKSLWAT